MKNRYTFEWELFLEIVTVAGKEFEHVGFKSDDGSFEKLLNEVADIGDLPKKATIVMNINSS